jgi:alkanesulfonate monooxygenase SsuD/methylene tetrahydromethanopterin reductase-like flavin-dependent oxidoreductase (luciferase family)
VKIGIEIDWQRRRFDVNRTRVELADRLGYDMVFCAEAHGSDALTPLGYVLAATERIGVGTRIAQNTSRSAPALAMAFQTLRHMAGPDREIIAGLGNSNPAMTEGWHGRPWTSPYWRMRDYVAIMRKAFRGEPVEHDGRAISIPYREPDGQPTYPAMQPLLETDPDIPIMFGGGTELMTTNAAEVADGLMPNGSWSPGMMKVYRPMLEKGFAKRATPMTVEDFPIWAHVDVLVTDDVKAAMGQFKEYTAQYVAWGGGKGGLYTHMAWRGYGDAADRIIELYLDGRVAEAEAAVPDEYIDECWLIGPLPRILERWRSRWIDDGCNLIVRTDNWPSAKPADDSVYEPLLRALRN